MAKSKRKPVFVAIVVTPLVAGKIKGSGPYLSNGHYTSGRTEGGWEAFIGVDKKSLIQKATDLATVWNRQGGSNPGYIVVAGQIGGEIKVVRTFKPF